MKLTPHLIGNPLNAPQQQQTEQTKCPRFGSSGNERKANEAYVKSDGFGPIHLKIV